MDQHKSKNFDVAHTLDLWVGLKGQILNCTDKHMLFIELNTKNS